MVTVSPADDRSKAIGDDLKQVGITPEFVKGAEKRSANKREASAFARGFDQTEGQIFLIVQDDQRLVRDETVLPSIPEGADVILLATANAGTLPNTSENREAYGTNAYDGLALVEVHDTDYYRVSSMAHAKAILICSSRGRARFREEIQKASNRSNSTAARLSVAIADLNAYALRAPLFDAVGGMKKTEPPQVSPVITSSSLRHAKVGEVRIARKGRRKIAVQAVRNTSTALLGWDVIADVRQDETLKPIKTHNVRLPLYHQDVLKDRFDVIPNARVFPPDPEAQSCGVTDEIGQFSILSAEFKWIRRPMLAPETERMAGPLKQLKGTYIYGGWLHPHFGHFLAESTARLWALAKNFGKIDGVLFIPYGPRTIWRTRRKYGPILNLFAGETPITPLTGPAIVDKLIVPEPGFGHQSRMLGSREYIDFVRNRVSSQITPEGGDRIYISRSKLNAKRGGIFGETSLEAFLAENGYEIFHPQQHSAEEQLSRYAAARYIISLDGSPLHFASFALRPDAKVAIVKRRTSTIQERMAEQVRRFSGAEVHVMDHIEKMWVREHFQRIDYSSYGELDFVGLGDSLRECGFLKSGAPAPSFGVDQIAQELENRPAELGPLVPLEGP
ncbi:glycosyltransferase family 61 protein [Yoonia litorea]|uniref:glycosyltransferase family 61 protein n=1 Tax=Yoonia litorea TaxID=1123755 RepID=UPI000B7D1E19|nr:glycosyltransferase family 61 protein [Yoonia litorea]